MAEHTAISVSGIDVQIVRKDIKNLHLGVYPPDGHVRVAAPRRLDDDAVRLAVIDRLKWIRRRIRDFESQPRQSKRELITGESHHFLGRRYRLDVVEQNAAPRVRLRNRQIMELRVRPGAGYAKRDAILSQWYREQLRERLPQRIACWQARVGVQVAEVRVRKMKTRWGSCNVAAERIWLNTALAAKPPECLDYVLVHEMAHLMERHHNDRFRQLMDHAMPNWRLHRDTLNQAPLAHETWTY